MYILLVFLFFGLFLLLLVVSGIFAFVRRILSFGRKQGPSRQTTSTNAEPLTPKKKIFNSDEGEYVNFEEVDNK